LLSTAEYLHESSGHSRVFRSFTSLPAEFTISFSLFFCRRAKPRQGRVWVEFDESPCLVDVGLAQMTKEEILVAVAGSVVGTAVIELLKPSVKALWARMNRPSPLSLQDKVRLAEQVTMQEQALERLNHLSLHSKDVFLYLFKLGLGIFLAFSAAMFLFAYQPLFSFPPFLLIVLGSLLSIVAFVEANRLSAKNIDATKAKVKKFIDEGKAKLNLPLRPTP
jgi:hypothetical protein